MGRVWRDGGGDGRRGIGALIPSRLTTGFGIALGSPEWVGRGEDGSFAATTARMGVWG